MKNTFFKWFFISLLVCALGGNGFSAELKDYRLPSEKRQGGSSATGVEQQKSDAYREFRIMVAKLTPGQKKELRESFCKKLQATNKEDERNYYLNLIKIIDESGQTR